MSIVGVIASASMLSARRRNILAAPMFYALLTAIASAQTAHSTWRPVQPVEWLIPASAGSQLDAIVRLGQTVLQQRKLIDVPIVPTNKAGAGQSIAANLLLNRPAGDGQTLAVFSATLLSAQALGAHKLDFRAATPLAYLGAEYYVYAVRADSTIGSGKDLIDRLRRDPRSLTLGTSNLGGVGHIQMLAALRAAGVDTRQVVVVGFKGGSQARTALLSGDIDVNTTSGSNMAGEVGSGRVRVVAVNAPRRLPGIYASAPTWKELGVDSPVLSGWAAVLGPKGLAEAQIAYWERVFSELMRSPEWIVDAERRFRSLDYRDSAATRSYLEAEYKTLEAVIPQIGIVQR